MFEDFDFGHKIINKYIDFNVKEGLNFEQQCFSYKEDMIQISYEENYVLDVGWYPDSDLDGLFKVVVIKDYDWVKPLRLAKCRDIHTLKEYLHDYVIFIQKKLYY